MKTLGKILLVFLLIGGLGAGAVFYFTADMVKSVDAFFTAAAEEDFDGAYDVLSTQAQASIPRDQVIDFIGRYHFDEYQSASWTSRTIEGGTGTLKGTVVTGSGSVPITLTLIKEGGQWAILNFKMTTPGVVETAAADDGIPSREQLVALVNETMVTFGEAINAGSMAVFRDHISAAWQGEATVEDLDRTFGSFYGSGADLTVLGKLTPSFDPEPRLDDRGVLTLEGSYPTQPTRIDFENLYYIEDGEWKLISLGVWARDATPTDPATSDDAGSG